MNQTDAARGMSSHAKVNLFLEVTDKRSDGFHAIESVFVSVDFADTLFGRVTDAPGVSLVCSDPSLPVDEGNLVVRAVLALRRRCGMEIDPRAGLDLRLEKVIPSGAGLGGGSSNAALALRMADSLWGTGLSSDAILRLAAGLGSDVPFFLRGGTCLCRGRGEIIAPLADFPPEIPIILALPDIHSNTAAAYRGLVLPRAGEGRSAEEFVRAMCAGDVAGMERSAFNRFEATVFAALPDLRRLHGELEDLAARPVRMSGSGAALWHFASREYADSLRENRRLSAWAEENRIRLMAVRATPALQKQPARA